MWVVVVVVVVVCEEEKERDDKWERKLCILISGMVSVAGSNFKDQFSESFTDFDESSIKPAK